MLGAVAMAYRTDRLRTEVFWPLEFLHGATGTGKPRICRAGVFSATCAKRGRGPRRRLATSTAILMPRDEPEVIAAGGTGLVSTLSNPLSVRDGCLEAALERASGLPT
jgi:hypothetical protein